MENFEFLESRFTTFSIKMTFGKYAKQGTAKRFFLKRCSAIISVNISQYPINLKLKEF